MKKKNSNPGVFVEVIRKFPTSIAQVETAIPAFIGYTEYATKDNTSLLNTPTRINSFLEFEEYFGGSFPSKFQLVPVSFPDPNAISVNGQQQTLNYLPNQQGFLHASVKGFFANRGQSCTIVSVGNYGGAASLPISKESLINGIQTLVAGEGTSAIVIPDAVVLENEAFEVYQAMLLFAKQTCRFAILDIPNALSDTNPPNPSISNFRTRIGEENLTHGAAYYPWLLLSLNEESFVPILNHIPLEVLIEILPESDAKAFLNNDSNTNEKQLHLGLASRSPIYLELIKLIEEKLSIIPPSGYVAGNYSRTDFNRGVWKAPAGLTLRGVRHTTGVISPSLQEALTSGSSGKSINVIREYPKKGILVYGARTLAVNDPEWRYVPIRRSFCMIKESLRKGLSYLAFEPNERKTWFSVKSVVSKFLTLIWRSGGLAGAKQEEAFFVNAGLGETMTNQEILENKLIVEIGLAFVRPAEFTVLRLEFKTGTS
jgi:phage tail sheath protein FI